jgi:Zn-dependent M28 family amino/carboxypeptidase
MKKTILLLLFFWSLTGSAQTNISLSNPTLLSILKAEHDPTQYQASTVINGHDQIICELNDAVSADTLRAYLEVLGAFETRHTWSDTVSATRGVGAARRWILNKFRSFSDRTEGRLQTGYLVFDIPNNTCGSLSGTKNVLAVLPGSDTSLKEIVVIEAHMDSRCEDRCDTACIAEGIDDNGSGTALVLELARVMSKYTFDRTIMFMATTGEEQGLLGADAMAQFAQDNNIEIRAVQNNDIVAGTICGITASPPGCSPPGSVDSMNLRIYANPISYLAPHQSFARSVKMFYDEKLKPIVQVPMSLNVMGQEDRTGRGGDHIPFRERGYRNLRFTSSNEHGNGAPDASYTDRQHTVNDVLGIDTDGDQQIDSFFVDFNYLARNTLINASSAAILALGPEIPEFILHNESTGLRVEVTNPSGAIEYRVGVRDGSATDFDALYSFNGTSFLIPDQVSGQFYYVSVAAIDSVGIMSPFTKEERSLSQSNTSTGTQATLDYGINCQQFGGIEFPEPSVYRNIQLVSAHPNPFREKTEFIVMANELSDEEVKLVIATRSGKIVATLPVNLEFGKNVVPFDYDGPAGFLIVTLKVGERILQSRKIMAR